MISNECPSQPISISFELASVDEYIEKGSKILEEMKIPFQTGYFTLIHGEIEVRRGKRDEAGKLFEQARVIFEDLGYTHYIEKVDNGLKAL